MTSHGRGGEGNIGSISEGEGFATSEHTSTSPINIGGSSTSTHPQLQESYHSPSTSNPSQSPTSSSPPHQRRVSVTTLNEEHGGHLGHYKGVPFFQSPQEAEKVIRQRKEKAGEVGCEGKADVGLADRLKGKLFGGSSRKKQNGSGNGNGD